MLKTHVAAAIDHHPVARALYAVNRLFGRAYHEIEVLSPCVVPRKGPAIVICNHSAGIDPVLLQAACPRIITWMVATEYAALPGLKQMCKFLRYIPVTRTGKDSASLKAAFRALASNRVLGVFPEGRIETDHDFLPFQPGAAMLAARSGVPMYPAYIAGLTRNMGIGQSLLEPQKVVLAFGEPITPIADGPRLTELMQAALGSLKKHCLAARPLRNASPRPA